MDPTKRFCELCQNASIDLTALKSYYKPGDAMVRRIRFPDSQDLAAKNPPFLRFSEQFSTSCPLCQIIWNAVPHDQKIPIAAIQLEAEQNYPESFQQLTRNIALSPIRYVAFSLGHRSYYPCSLINVITWGRNEESNDDSQEEFIMGDIGRLRVFTEPESASSLTRRISGRSICLPNSDLNMGNIKQWLDTCFRRHPKCRKGLSGVNFRWLELNILPSRVVDVGLGGSSQVRVVETNGKRGRYCALSYCWGPPAPNDNRTTLRSDTLDMFLQALPVPELPRTIQEAIDVTRRIGISYLWVDRLCIIQNNDADTKKECDQMCNIYEGAFLTLATLGDDTGTKGFFLDREVLDHPTTVIHEAENEEQPLWRVKLPCRIKDKPLGEAYLGNALNSFSDNPRPDRDSKSCFDQELEASRWVTRGWILQERLLSRRIVYFGKRQLYWECGTAFRNEDGTASGPDHFNVHEVGFPKQGFTEKLSSPFTGLFTGKFGIAQHNAWAELVGHYSSRNLSQPTDKLRAVNGVAEALRRRFSLNGYYHGIWAEYLSHGLTWYSVNTLTRRSGEQYSIGKDQVDIRWLINTDTNPSWSWAGWDGEILYKHRVTENAIQCVKGAEFGEIDTNPALKLTVAMVPIQPRRVHNDKGDHDGRIDEFAEWVEIVTNFSTSEFSVWPWLMRNKSVGFNAIATVDSRPVGVIKYDNFLDPADGCASLLLSCEQEPFAEKSEVYWYYFLVLEKMEDGPSGAKRFRRVGLGEGVWAREDNVGFPFHNQPETDVVIL